MANYNSLFISDIHLGTFNSQTNKLLNFLEENTFERIFLLGDIIDIQQMEQNLFWKNEHNHVIQKIMKISKKVPVTYLYGNHDEFLQLFENEYFGSIQIKEKERIKTLKGENVLLMHGHQMDGFIKSCGFLYKLGDSLYSLAIKINHYYNQLRKKLGKEYWSLSHFLKTKFKKVIQFINNFENLIVQEAQKEQSQIVIAGHIHTSEDKKIKDIRYLNCGCFTEYTSAVIEDKEGNLKVIDI